MSDIITLFKLIFFLKTILLTPSPINISNEWVSIKPSEPLEAITGGAAIHIDITQFVKPFQFDEVSKKFPNGGIEGKLIQQNGKEILLISKGSSHGNNTVRLIVSGVTPVSTDTKFVEVKLKSKINIESSSIYWKNGIH
jgi:hypothetical protein